MATASYLTLLCLTLYLSSAVIDARIFAASNSCPVVSRNVNQTMAWSYGYITLKPIVKAINSAGTIAGWGTDSFVSAKPYSKNSTVKFPGAATTAVAGINAKGIVVGSITKSSATSYSFGFANNGSYGKTTGYTSYQHPNAPKPPTTAGGPYTGTFFTFVNDNNTVVGYYIDSNSFSHGFSFSLGTKVWTPIAPAYNVSVQPTGINNNGVVVGSVTCLSGSTQGVTYGFSYSKGTFTYFSVRSSFNTQPLGLNNNGYVVGTYQPRQSSFLATFIATSVTSSAGKVAAIAIDKAAPGTTVISGINDNKMFVGSFYPVAPPFDNGFVAVQDGSSQ